MFLVDGSSNITKHFEKQKIFITLLVQRLEVAVNRTHVGVIMYSESSFVKTIFGLNDHYSLDDIREAILNISYPDTNAGGYVNIGKALDKARTDVYAQGNRKQIPNVCIVLTDGKGFRDNITGPSQALKNYEGTKIFVVGKGHNRSELEVMASTPSEDFVITESWRYTSQVSDVAKRVRDALCLGTVYDHTTSLSTTVCSLT